MTYLATVKTEKMGDDAVMHVVSEKYLVEASTYTEAEDRITNECAEFSNGEFDVTGLQRQNIADIICESPKEKWFITKIAFITLDEKTLKERRINSRFYVNADDFDEACKMLVQFMSSSMANYLVLSVAETAVIDYFK